MCGYGFREPACLAVRIATGPCDDGGWCGAVVAAGAGDRRGGALSGSGWSARPGHGTSTRL
jgi:hypothetical protein